MLWPIIVVVLHDFVVRNNNIKIGYDCGFVIVIRLWYHLIICDQGQKRMIKRKALFIWYDKIDYI